MKPCAIVIEVSAWSASSDYYVQLIEGKELLMYRIEETYANSEFSKNCTEHTQDGDQLGPGRNKKCAFNTECHVCARYPISVSLSFRNYIPAILREALPMREQCMRRHPLYNSTVTFDTYIPFNQHCPFMEEGTLFKTEEYGADCELFWVIQNNKKRQTNLKAFVANGWHFEDVLYCPKRYTEGIPEGSPLPKP
jgi:hypothetical protein